MKSQRWLISTFTDIVFGKGWGLYSLWASIGLIAYVYSLSRSTTAYCKFHLHYQHLRKADAFA